MKYLILINIILLSHTSKGDLYGFPVGERPSVSMVTALKFFEDYNNKRNTQFNPSSCFLAGGPNKGEGSWTITQFNINGDEIKYIYYFPKDMCIIHKVINRRIIVEAFKRDGTPIPLKDNSLIDENEPNPFSSKPDE